MPSPAATSMPRFTTPCACARTPSHATGPKQLPWHQPRLRFPAVAAVSADELEAIHDASLTILEEIGMDVLLPEARVLLEAAGAEVEADGQRVRMARELVLDAVSTCPATFRLHARNPAHDV